jgi:hypothetical protein
MPKIGIMIVGTILLCIGVVVLGGSIWTNITTVDYQFNDAVHSHVENAYYSSDPETMRSELSFAVEGMHKLGLEDSMYNAVFPWNRIPSNKMEWQYKHMASIFTRIDEWEKWESAQNATGSQQMQDVNTQKLDNVRNFILKDGWSDDVASGAYTVNFYFGVIIGFWVGFIAIILGIFVGMAGLFMD